MFIRKWNVNVNSKKKSGFEKSDFFMVSVGDYFLMMASIAAKDVLSFSFTMM